MATLLMSKTAFDFIELSKNPSYDAKNKSSLVRKQLFRDSGVLNGVKFDDGSFVDDATTSASKIMSNKLTLVPDTKPVPSCFAILTVLEPGSVIEADSFIAALPKSESEHFVDFACDVRLVPAIYTDFGEPIPDFAGFNSAILLSDSRYNYRGNMIGRSVYSKKTTGAVIKNFLYSSTSANTAVGNGDVSVKISGRPLIQRFNNSFEVPRVPAGNSTKESASPTNVPNYKEIVWFVVAKFTNLTNTITSGVHLAPDDFSTPTLTVTAGAATIPSTWQYAINYTQVI